MDTMHAKIIYPLLAVLFIVLGLVLYQNIKLQKAVQGVSSSASALTPGHTATSTLDGVVVGSTQPANNAIIGTIAQIGGDSMKVTDQSGATRSISITADTRLQQAGKMKDVTTQQKELAAYNAQADLLLKDPVKNKAALATMRVPTPQEVSPATLVDFKVGDSLMVEATAADSNGVYTALTITKAAPVQ